MARTGNGIDGRGGNAGSDQGRVYAVAPDAPMLAGATNSSAFQAGLKLPILAGMPISFG